MKGLNAKIQTMKKRDSSLISTSVRMVHLRAETSDETRPARELPEDQSQGVRHDRTENTGNRSLGTCYTVACVKTAVEISEESRKRPDGFGNRDHLKTAIFFHCGGLKLYPVQGTKKGSFFRVSGFGCFTLVLLRYDSERHSHGCMISDAGTPGFSGFSSDHMDAIPVILTTM